MTQKHSSIKRIIHRISEELNATRRIAKITSWKEAFATLQAKIDIQVMNRNGYNESKKQKEHLLKKHEVMLKYYEKTFSDFLKTYDYSQNQIINQSKSPYSNCIWVCWWQGLDQSPEIVKACVKSIKRNAGKHTVIILTEDNYRQYVDIPKWVEEKKNKGIITRTNYSDLLRLSLLAKHGGLWLDATFYCTKPIPDEYFDIDIWSIRRPDYAHASVASGYFAGYSLACNQESRWMFAIIRDFFLNYWKNNDMMVDYLMIDYMIVLAQRINHEIAQTFDKIPSNNPLCDELIKNL
ncbi:TPA: capsular polysaccharide synthesis protein, partial [Enterococcus faecium]|nr:capsular polysaccharide synthesis protein [Enterococcus faecium]HDL0831708.1 capsular polysaccharide synthesis protein [Enterococcus faecium]